MHLVKFVFHKMPYSCIFKTPRIWQVFWYMTWYGKNMRKKYRKRQVLWADALIKLPCKTGERNHRTSALQHNMKSRHLHLQGLSNTWTINGRANWKLAPTCLRICIMDPYGTMKPVSMATGLLSPPSSAAANGSMVLSLTTTCGNVLSSSSRFTGSGRDRMFNLKQKTWITMDLLNYI